jgi:glutamate/tyrosine decarboxylase-like PLP-dependent enzyme
MVEELFMKVAHEAIHYRDTLLHRPVGVALSHDELAAMVNTELPDDGETPDIAIRSLITSVEKGLVNNANPRYFGFVTSGALPISVAADWLVSVWNQNAQVYSSSPAASIIEDVVAHWLMELLSLPPDASVGFVTGTQMASFTALSIAKNAVLRKFGWDIDTNGLQESPHINIVCGECCHATIHSAIRMIGLGTKNIKFVQADSEGRIRMDAFRHVLDTCSGPTIVCVQAGNVNTGAFDPIEEILTLTTKRDIWVHVDGAFGLWAGASLRFKHLVTGVERADSWATDAHKWLNVPYDSGIVVIRTSEDHRNLKIAQCAYAKSTNTAYRDGSQWAPENSRRARGFVLYAVLRCLGKKGVQRIVENCCDMAKVFAAELARMPNIHIMNQVVLNQVLFRIEPKGLVDTDSFNSAVASRIQNDGICWIGTTEWQGKTVLRISVSHWATANIDVQRSMQSIINSIEQELVICK